MRAAQLLTLTSQIDDRERYGCSLVAEIFTALFQRAGVEIVKVISAVFQCFTRRLSHPRDARYSSAGPF